MNESSNNAEKCRIWSNEIGCTVCQKLVEYKYSEMKDPNEKLYEVVFDCYQKTLHYIERASERWLSYL